MKNVLACAWMQSKAKVQRNVKENHKPCAFVWVGIPVTCPTAEICHTVPEAYQQVDRDLQREEIYDNVHKGIKQ